MSSYSRMRVPFGRISRVDILEARKVLQKLASLREELDKKRNDKADVEEIHKVYRKQTETSNQFYRLMPLGGFENGLLPVIDSEDIVKNYEQMLSELLDFETAGQIITAAAEMRSSIDPYLYILNAIECELTLMDHECIMSQRILQYIQNSSKSCRVQAIYRVKSKEATQLFNENALQKPNHRYVTATYHVLSLKGQF
ncbi:unnamed protein product [Anisakis simplex]|uniref:PARP alpha-helical domain-containing protein n=2 Tax=Anisakis simplex TaxID=6269 RepID=A0A3P6NCM6_ANISI|nr:unnamed protein product [Anisakis simplex]